MGFGHCSSIIKANHNITDANGRIRAKLSDVAEGIDYSHRLSVKQKNCRAYWTTCKLRDQMMLTTAKIVESTFKQTPCKIEHESHIPEGRLREQF